MKRKIWKSITILGCLFLIATPLYYFWTAYDRITPPPLDLGALISEDGGFVFPGTFWGMSLAELEESLGRSLSRPESSSDDVKPDHDFHNDTDYESAMFSVDNFATVFGRHAKATFQFFRGELVAVYLDFPMDKNNVLMLEMMSESLKAELELLCGEYMFWEWDMTKFPMIDKTTEDGEPTASAWSEEMQATMKDMLRGGALVVKTYEWENLESRGRQNRVSLVTLHSYDNSAPEFPAYHNAPIAVSLVVSCIDPQWKQ